MNAANPDSLRHIFRISDLCALLERYLEPDQVKEVYRAYLFGAEAHDGQQRLSGEPYITHPLAVAKILAELYLDHQSIMAAILHDVIEDTPTAREHLAEEFGEEVAALVDGVSKITHLHFESKAAAQAENFRKMMLAMVQDIRVILIKLADRLHNMRTLDVMRPDKRRRIARETLEIYAPIAARLGMNRIRIELEDLGFAALYPMRYRVLRDAVSKARGHRNEVVQTILTAIRRRLRQEGMEAEVYGREKHLYSIYKKMRAKHLSFQDVYDMYAFRIVVDRVDTCYRVLGAVHNLFKPLPGRFKDYIAIPKSNGYQSLHTVLFGPYGVYLEVQIRTTDMDKVAERGVAAHWMYKTGESNGTSAEARARQWLQNLLELQKNAGSSMEFIENVKIDLFPDEIYVFTPRGDILELPAGATVVDFAYAVHTDIGNTCVAAKVDRRLTPLHTVLRSGQTVHIITARGARPNPAWLSFVVTAKARTALRSYLKRLRRSEAVALGGRLFRKALAAHGTSLEELPQEPLDKTLEAYQLTGLDELLEEIGLGKRMAPLVVQQMLESEGPAEGRLERPARGGLARPLVIRGTEGMVVSFAKCCRPIPDDEIIGYMSAGRGVVIHRRRCSNVSDGKGSRENWLNVEWSKEVKGEFLAEIQVDVANQRGALATVAAEIADCESDIDNVTIDERDGLTTTMKFVLSVHDRHHLAQVMRRLHGLRMVVRVARKRM